MQKLKYNYNTRSIFVLVFVKVNTPKTNNKSFCFKNFNYEFKI